VFSPDGHTLASGSYDKTVRLWDAHTGASISVLEGHQNTVTSVVFSPDGHTLASGSHDNTVRLWDAHTGASLSVLEGHQNWVTSVVFSPDGHTLASGSDDKTVRLWDAHTGASLSVLEGHQNTVRSVVFSPDGQVLSSQSVSGNWLSWSIPTGELLSNKHIQLPNPSAQHQPTQSFTSLSIPDLSTFQQSGITFSIRLDHNWLCMNLSQSDNYIPILMFPSTHPPFTATAHSNGLVAVGCENGKVVIFDFSSILLAFSNS
jgi:WD40 repeat protein